MGMELRHLRYFIAVAEELHFSRAAERLHIEQSPLSRTIKQLETELGVVLLERNNRRTQLTWAGKVFLEDARRVLFCIDQAVSNAKAAATGYHGTLRIALSDDIPRGRLAALLALCREEEPDVAIRLFEVPLSEQHAGLCNDMYDAGFALSNEVDEGLVAEPIWHDALVLAVPPKHPLLAHKQVPLHQALRYPLVLCRPETCPGCSQQLEHLLSLTNGRPEVVERVASHDLMLALVAAGYGIGFSTAKRLEVSQPKDIVVRPLTGLPMMMTSYLLRSGRLPSEQLIRFMDRATRVGS